ncbi:MAG: DUF4255 domain-containing protein [Pseudomonadota bacterium]
MGEGTIFSAVKFIAEELNAHLRQVYSGNDDQVLLGRVQGADDSSPEVTNKTVITLVNTEVTPMPVAHATGSFARQSPPIHLHLFVLVSAHHTDYAEVLKNISYCAEFFQSHMIFTHSNSIDLPGEILKLDLELQSLNLDELSKLWGMLGGKHCPGLYYRIRMITLDSTHVVADVENTNAPVIGSST